MNMGKWIAIAVKDDKYAIPLENMETECPATFDTFEEAKACYDQHPFGRMYSGWALDLESGDVEAL